MAAAPGGHRKTDVGLLELGTLLRTAMRKIDNVHVIIAVLRAH